MRNMKKALSRSVIASSIQGTTSVDANRKRYSSGIFLSQIPFIGRFCLSEIIEFAVRLINRNKASNRTNKVSRSIAVVETVSHPTKGGTHILTKQLRNPTMKTSQKSTALLAVRSRTSIAFAPAMEVTYA
ncbi:TPA: hypothetical protein ACY38A_000953 [Pasteurella multocida]